LAWCWRIVADYMAPQLSTPHLPAISAAQINSQELTVRGFVTAAAIGLGAGIAITIVFQEIFLVRLP